jgi:hypothetical protein
MTEKIYRVESGQWALSRKDPKNWLIQYDLVQNRPLGNRSVRIETLQTVEGFAFWGRRYDYVVEKEFVCPETGEEKVNLKTVPVTPQELLVLVDLAVSTENIIKYFPKNNKHNRQRVVSFDFLELFAKLPLEGSDDNDPRTRIGV